MIEHIQLKNFKSILAADIPLKKLNILIGRNGSGKSNFLKFFELLHEGANKNFNPTINALGGFSELIRYDATAPLQWEITFGEVQGMEAIYYAGEISRRGVGYTISVEELSRPPYPTHTNRFKYLSVTNGRVRILKYDNNETEAPYDESDQELVIAQVRNRVRYPILYEIQEMMTDWQVFRGFGSEVLQNIRGSQLFNVVEPLRLDVSGKNLVSILQQLANQPEYQTTYEQLIATMQAIFPDFVKFDTPISAGGMGSLNYRSRDFNRPIPAISMSDGQLRFLGLLMLLLQPNPPSLITIDEPEIGLHPEMLEIFAELLKQASERTQLIIATHSPRLIDFMDLDNVILVEREAGHTVLERPDAERLNLWLDRYTLGKLWTMGKLAVR